ncbi:MAG: hypothetical protein QM778_06995 [Myxococcales bacterium]
MRPTRKSPRGYRGVDHVTIGSDILAVLKVLRMPEQVLGKDEADKLARVDANAWYPIAWLLELMDTLDRAVGHYGLVQMGRKLFQLSHERRVKEVARSARDIVYGIDGMYRFANRGVGIGGWRVLQFEQGQAVLEKTTPHHCGMEQGILAEAIAAMGCTVNIEQTQCLRHGADSCVFALSSTVIDERWMGSASVSLRP